MLNKLKLHLPVYNLLFVLLFILTACSNWSARTKDLSDFTNRDQSLAKSVLSVEWRQNLGKSTFPLQSPSFSSGVAVHPKDPFVAVAGYDGKLRMIHQKTGNLIWTKKIKAVGIAKPLILDDIIYLCTEDGKLSAIDLQSKETLWSKQFSAPINHEIIYDDQQIYVSDGTNSIYAIHRYQGDWQWQRKREAPVEFSMHGHAVPVYHQGKILMGFSDGHLSFIDAQSGQIIWDQDLSPDHDRFEDVDADAVVIGDIVYAASIASGLYALQLSDGKVLWSYPLPGIVSLSRIDDTLLLGLQNGEMLRWNPTTKSSIYRIQFDEDGVPQRPVLIGPYVMVSLSRGGFYVFDQKDGKIRDIFTPGSPMSKHISTTADGWVYVSSQNGYLYAFSHRELQAITAH